MIFVNPLVLIGLIAAVLPLLVHLFNFRRPKRLEYSSLALLQSIQRVAVQRVRIRNWLLLLLRTLALCALVFMFARPTLVGSSSMQFLGRSNVSAVLAIDGSLSMMQRDAEGTRLEQAKAMAQSIVGAASPGDELFIMRTDEEQMDAANDLTELPPTYATIAATSVIRQAAELLNQEATHLNRVIYYVGDLQESTLTDSVQTPLKEGVRVMLIPVGGMEVRANVGITDVRIVSRIVDPGTPVAVEATVVNHGRSPIEDYAVSLYLEDRRVAQTSVALAPDVPVSAVLRGVPETRGWTAGYVTTEDDGLAEDNQRHFTLNVPERRDILVVQGARARTEHVELALSLRNQSGGLQTTKISQRTLAAAPLSRYSAIFLVGPDALSSGEVGRLDQYVQDGGGLLIFPGADPAPVNALMEIFEAGRVTIQEWETSIESADFEHPLFEGVFTASERTQRLEAVRVHRAARYVPGTAAEQTLITLLGEVPLLQEIQYEDGHVLFLAVAPELSWSDLPVRGLFVPLMYRAAHYLSAGGSVQGEKLQTGQEATIRIPAVQGQITLQMPDGTQQMPTQRQVFGASLITFEADSPGITQVWAGNRPVRLVSVGLDPRESRLSYVDPEAAVDLLEGALGVPVAVLEVDSGNETAMRQARGGIELWRHFLALALVLLAAEMMVASRWRSR